MGPSSASQPGRGALGRALRSTWLRALVTLALLALVASKVDWPQLGDQLRSGHQGWLAVAVALVLLALVVGALRWWKLLQAAGVHLPPGELARVYAIATFSGTFLPTSVGGDVARALLVTRDRTRLVRVGITVVADRAGAVAGLLAVAWGGVVLHPRAAPHGAVAALAVLTAAIASGGVVLLLAARRPAGPLRRLPARLRNPLREVRELILLYSGRPATLAWVIATSVVFQALVTIQLCAIAKGFGVELGFPEAAVTLTLVALATLIPVSIGGFGIRESSYVVLLGGVGISATDATAISLATVAVLAVASLPGAYFLVRRGTSTVTA